MELKINGELVDLPDGFQIPIEDTSPIFNDVGSQTVPVTLPPTRNNMRIMMGAHRVDSAAEWCNDDTAELADGVYRRLGMVNLTQGCGTSGYSLNVGFDNSVAYAKWKDKKLRDLSTLPVLEDKEEQSVEEQVIRLMYALKALRDGTYHGDPVFSEVNDLAVFTVALQKDENSSTDESNTNNDIIEWLNHETAFPPFAHTKVTRKVDGVVKEVSVPLGYGISPMVKVYSVIDMIFADLGVEVMPNKFSTDPDLKRLTVLNNCADAICTGKIDYHDLMPDVTVGEFLNALWVRFGLTYFIDFDKKTVDLRLLKDILADKTLQNDIQATSQGAPNINYLTPQYIKLSAATSLQDAAPATERFEDFVQGCDIDNIRHGADVRSFKNTGTPNYPKWDFDEYPDPEEPEPPEEPDPEPPEPDIPEPDWDYSTGHGTSNEDSQKGRFGFLAREYVDGDWFLLDATNNTVAKTSTPFFNWDPQTPGLEAKELNSCDEFVPVIKFVTRPFFAPYFSAGSRHYHSYIKSAGSLSENDGKTPLAFLFAYVIKDGLDGNGKQTYQTIGRFCPESEDGKTYTLYNNTKPKLSLLFQFKGGLFDTFWRDYDKILRHGNREIETTCRIAPLTLKNMTLWRPILFNSVTCLIDKMNYSLPCGKLASVDVTLRPILMRGETTDSEEYLLIKLPNKETDNAQS